MKVKVNDGDNDIVITMDVSTDRVDTPLYEPNDEYLKYLLSQESGYYGHTINPEYTTPLDLYTALVSLRDIYKVIDIDEVPVPKPMSGLITS